MQPHGRKAIRMNIWSVAKGAAWVAIAALVILNIPDIKRYIRISTM